ncbi:uncharacterized protein LOC134436170 [Engraulis encrasicolus]|uniref:uncharacterized protein LOC134436170 n=1 Tax=Engraulis encrasicolus TaxID=184585 RepID=UPI002FD176A6
MPFWSRLCGRDKMTHHPPISDEDLVILKTSTALQPSNPESLLQKVWFDIQLHFGQRGCEGKRQLKPDSFTLARDENGRQYYTMTFNEETKKNKNPMEKTRENNRGAMYEEPGNPLCPVASLTKYLQKIPADGKALYLNPRQHVSPTDDVWYTTVPVKKNQLSQMLPRLSLEAGTKVQYTIHNLRATAIQKLSEARTPSPADSEVVTTDSDSGHDTESTSSSTNLDSNSSGRGSEGSPTEDTNLV